MIDDGSRPSYMDPTAARTPSSTALQSTTQQPWLNGAALSEAGLAELDSKRQYAAGAFAAKVRTWHYELTPTDTTIVAVTNTPVETPDAAFTNAVRLRDELISAAGCGEVRGFIAAETLNDDDLNVAGSAR